MARRGPDEGPRRPPRPPPRPRVHASGPRRAPRATRTRVRHPRPSLPSQHVQALLHSLSRVLCTFPSRYLSAIGLPRVLSLGWGLPPASSCSPKQLDSSGRPLARSHAGAAPRTPRAPRGSHPPWRPLPRDFARAGPAGAAPLQATPRPPGGRFSAWAASLFTRRYWGSPRSFLFPPPTDMLKSGGSSCGSGGPVCVVLVDVAEGATGFAATKPAPTPPYWVSVSRRTPNTPAGTGGRARPGPAPSQGLGRQRKPGRGLGSRGSRPDPRTGAWLRPRNRPERRQQGHSAAHAARLPAAQAAFEASMTRGALQFARTIAVGCVLHRRGSPGIRC